MNLYGKIFKQAYAILRAHKFLWALGLFLFWDAAFNLLSWTSSQDQLKFVLDIRYFVSSHANALVWILLALIGVVVFLQLCFRSRAGIIIGVKLLSEKKPVDFRSAFAESRIFYLRIFGIWFITIFLLLLASAILAGPVAYLSSINLEGRAQALGLIALVIFIPLAVVANFVNNLAPVFVVFYDFKVPESVRASMDMVRKFWPMLLGFSIYLGFLTGIAVSLFAIVWGAGVVFLGHLFYNTHGIGIKLGAISLSLVAIGAFLIFNGFVSAFQQIAWVLMFKEIIRPVKMEDEEAVPAPEII
jgi:hypothetical protein